MSPRTQEQSDQQTAQRAAPAPTQSARRFEGKVVLVTGVSPRGIGGAVAERLAEEGAAVSLTSLDKPGELLKKLEPFEGRIQWTPCDVCQQQQIDHAVDACTDQFGKIDILVNNAGVEMTKPFRDTTDDMWQELLDVNLTGAVRMTRAALPHMEFKGGVIVNVSSASSFGGTPGLVAYSATKAGLNGLTQSLAAELASKGIRVVGVAPALVRTPMAARHIESISAEGWEKIQECHPLGIGRPSDVASVVAFLASEEARWITGITLPLGWLPSYPLPFGE